MEGHARDVQGTECEVLMAKRTSMHIPLDFNKLVKGLSQTPPPPDVQGSWKAVQPTARKRTKREAAKRR